MAANLPAIVFNTDRTWFDHLRPEDEIRVIDEVNFRRPSAQSRFRALESINDETVRRTPALIDYRYRRNGTANIFMAVEPLAGWRHVTVTERRTKLDFAAQMAELSR